MTGFPEFNDLVEAAILRRQIEFPKIENQIRAIEQDLQKLDESEQVLRDQLLDSAQRSKAEFMPWLEG